MKPADLIARAERAARRLHAVTKDDGRTGHSVYVVLLHDPRPPERWGLYVGQTSRDPDWRFDQHKAGYKASAAVKRFGVQLLPHIIEHLTQSGSKSRSTSKPRWPVRSEAPASPGSKADTDPSWADRCSRRRYSRQQRQPLGMMVMVDKSWGLPGTSSFTVRPNDTGQRAADGAETREGRSAERAELMVRRQEARVARREADLQANEQARAKRREQEQQLAAADPHATAAQRRRGSRRRDLVREQRDISGYTMIVDVERIRKLASRGASVSGLSTVFGISQEEVEHALAD